MEITRPTIMEIDLDAFSYNVDQIQKYVSSNVKLMPVIKANAYGTYYVNVDEFNIGIVKLLLDKKFNKKSKYEL